MPEKAG